MLKSLLRNRREERDQKTLLAFEYGLNLSECAREMNIPLTKEHIERAEEMIANEFATHDASFLAGNMVPNLMTVFEFEVNK
jgi:hypothetical protein